MDPKEQPEGRTGHSFKVKASCRLAWTNMGAAMLIAHPALGVSLMICLGALYLLTRGLARLLTRGFAKESCTPKDKVALKRNRQTRKKLAKTRRCDIFHYGSRRVLLKEAGFKISGLTWLPSGLAMVS